MSQAAILMFDCALCGNSIEVNAELAGREIRCPHCNEMVPLPAEAARLGLAEAQTLAPAGPAARDAVTADYQPRDAPASNRYDFLAPPQESNELGRLGSYRVVAVRGSGGMGVVFEAEDPQLRRKVALKAMLPTLAASESARQRFLREARAAAALKHDHIVTIYQVGEDRGVPFLVMEFLEGQPLDVRLERQGKLTVAELLRIGREIALGLAAAHRRELIHRDIKPANIWLEAETGRVKILDFGLARAVGQENQLTQQGAIVGTPAYMAPEQAQGQRVDHRSDLFSLGCVLYRAGTGVAAFRGWDTVSTLLAVATQTPRPPAEVEPSLPVALSDLILSLLAREPDKRPASAQAVAEALERNTLERKPAPPTIEAKAPSLHKETNRRRWGRSVAVGAAVIALMLAALVLFQTKVKTPEGDEFLLNTRNSDANRVRLEPQPELAQKKIPADNLRREDIPEAVRVMLGGGDPKRAPPDLVAVMGDVRSRQVHSVAFSPDNRWLASAGEDNTVRIWDLATGTQQHKLGGHVAPVWFVAFSPDSKLVASGSHDGTIGVWDAVRGTLVHSLKGHSRESAVRFSPDGKFVAAGTADGGVHMWFARNGEEARLLPDLHEGLVRCLAFSTDGQRMASGGQDGKLVIADLASGKVLHSFQRKTAVCAVEFSGDGETVGAGYAAPESVVRLWSLKDKDFVALSGHTDRVTDVALRQNGRVAFTTSLDGSVRLWETGGDRPRKMVLGLGSAGVKLWSGALSPDGRYAATGNSDGTIYLFRLPEAAEDFGEWVAARASPPPGLTQEAWLERVKGLYAANVPDAVSDRLRELNPGFAEPVEWEFENGLVVGMAFWSAKVRDISPVRALSDLRTFMIWDGSLADLSPLKGLKLKRLGIWHTAVADLRPIKDMQLTWLDCARTEVSDLTPLKNMKLEWLSCWDTQLTSAGLTPLQHMSSLRDMGIGGRKMTEDGLARLKQLTNLESLGFSNGRVTEVGIRSLKEMPKLRSLELNNTGLTDEDLVYLKGFVNLRLLYIRQTRVTDAGLEHLAGLKNLVELNLHDTAVTDKGVAKLKAALPNCNIIR